MVLGRDRKSGVLRRDIGGMNSNSKSAPDLKESEMVPLTSLFFSDSTGDTVITATD